jgi:hypothetical protein
MDGCVGTNAFDFLLTIKDKAGVRLSGNIE